MTSDRIDPSHEALELGGSVWFKAGAQTLGGASRIAGEGAHAMTVGEQSRCEHRADEPADSRDEDAHLTQ